MRNLLEMLHSSARNNLTTELIVLALFIPRSFLLSFLVFVESKPMSANGLMATSGFACFAQHTSHFLWGKKKRICELASSQPFNNILECTGAAYTCQLSLCPESHTFLLFFLFCTIYHSFESKLKTAGQRAQI